MKALAVRTPWRREWQMGIRGLTYCTHALGPIMQWFQGDRVVRVCCEDAGSHYTDGEGEHFAGDTAVMLAKTEQGRLIKIRVDLTSNRPCKRGVRLALFADGKSFCGPVPVVDKK